MPDRFRIEDLISRSNSRGELRQHVRVPDYEGVLVEYALVVDRTGTLKLEGFNPSQLEQPEMRPAGLSQGGQ